jgi:translocation protein SEC72
MAGAGNHLDALVDAVMVIGMKRPWSKGHLRKGKALLALGRPEEAREAIRLGLSFEPTNAVSAMILLMGGDGTNEYVSGTNSVHDGD